MKILPVFLISAIVVSVVSMILRVTLTEQQNRSLQAPYGDALTYQITLPN